MKRALIWKPKIDFRGLIKMMIESDLEQARRENFGRNFRAV
jgi:GDP-D-mannose dehydratase